MRWQILANIPQSHAQPTRGRGNPKPVVISVKPVCDALFTYCAGDVGNIATLNIFIGECAMKGPAYARLYLLRDSLVHRLQRDLA